MAELAAIPLSAGPRSARRARRFVAARLAASGAEKFIDKAVLLTSELVSNVVKHVGSQMTLALSIADNLVRISVSDNGLETPVEREVVSPTDIGGRGLVIVDAISSAWGVERTAGGKAVWFELAA
jgi:anti-sigma regulatory factor (Ser/Thr protein kinase)